MVVFSSCEVSETDSSEPLVVDLDPVDMAVPMEAGALDPPVLDRVGRVLSAE